MALIGGTNRLSCETNTVCTTQGRSISVEENMGDVG